MAVIMSYGSFFPHFIQILIVNLKDYVYFCKTIDI